MLTKPLWVIHTRIMGKNRYDFCSLARKSKSGKMSESIEALQIRCKALEQYCVSMKNDLDSIVVSMKKDLDSARADLKALQVKYNKSTRDYEHLQRKYAKSINEVSTSSAPTEKEETGFDRIDQAIDISNELPPIPSPIVHVIAPKPKMVKQPQPVAKKPRDECNRCGQKMSCKTTSHWDCRKGSHVTGTYLSCDRCDRGASVMAF